MNPRGKTSASGSRAGAVILIVAAAAAATASTANAVGPGNVIYVGASAVDCDATSIGQALDLAEASAAANEIRLTRTLSYSNVNMFINDWDPVVTGDLVVSGGWDNCLDASPSGDTVVDGAVDGVVVEVAQSGASTAGISIVLRDLELTGANSGVAVSGVSATTPATVRLESSVSHGNEHGGSVGSGARLEIDGSSVIRNNEAVTPGGLFGAGLICIGPDSSISIAGTVRQNTVAAGFPSRGGGVFVSGGCAAVLEPGAVLEMNSVAGGGGGIAVVGDSTLAGGGSGSLEVRIAGNSASGGGGLMVNGVGSTAILQNVRIDGNAAIEGAGVHIESGGLVELEGAPSADCPDAPRCLTLSGNLLNDVGEGFGSAAFVLNGGEFRMYQGFIEGNGGFGDRGWLIMGYTQDNVFELEGVQIWNNRTRSPFLIYTSELIAGFLTVAGNSYWDPGTASYLDAAPAESYFGSTMGFYTSIFRDHAEWLKDASSNIHVDCLILETTAGTTSAGANMIGFDPLFRDAAAGDLRLRPGSPAIDGCDTLLYTPQFRDYEGDLRGYDSAVAPNTLGPFDRGADEAPLLFASGFESGTLVGWSSTAP